MRKNISCLLVGFIAGLAISLIQVIDHKEVMNIASNYISSLEEELDNVEDGYIDDVMSETDAYQDWYGVSMR